MLEWIKSVWTRWKVQVSVVGGVLVIATAYGTCSVEPATVSDATPTNTETSTTSEAVEVSSTTTETTEEGTTTDTTTETNTTTETE
jgi:hypothetical protein